MWRVFPDRITYFDNTGPLSALFSTGYISIGVDPGMGQFGLPLPPFDN